MKIESGVLGNFLELKLIGRLDSNTAFALENKLTQLIVDGNDDILINFTDLEYISSAGLRVFLVAAKMLEPNKKKINICSMRNFIKEVFDIAGFSSLFNIYNSREQILV